MLSGPFLFVLGSIKNEKGVADLACRRCGSSRLIKLEKKLGEDHDVFRCGECGYIFSPSCSKQLGHQNRALDAQEEEARSTECTKKKMWVARKMVGISRDRMG